MGDTKKTNTNGSSKELAISSPLIKELDESLCPICMDHPHNAVLLICSSRERGCRCYICDTSYRHSNCLDRFKIPTAVKNNNTNNNTELKCPLCRGTVFGWIPVGEVRQYLDQKPRVCSKESCMYFGTYKELRKHARRAHPLTRPGEVDRSRQTVWRRLEQRQEYGDILSAIRSAIPGAVILGDYAIESSNGGDRMESNGEDWWTPFVLFHMMGRNERRRRSEDERPARRRRRRIGWSGGERQ